MNHVALIGATSEFGSLVHAALDSRGTWFVREAVAPANSAELFDFVEKVLVEDPSVLLVGPLLNTTAQLKIAEHVDRTRPEISVVLVAALSAEEWQYALRVGARDVVAPHSDVVTLQTSIEHACAVSEQRRRILVQSVVGPAVARSARLITVISPKGGSGKTVTSTNLAVALAQMHPERVALVDLDVQFGDVAMALRIEPEYTLATAVHGRLDGPTLRAQMVRHESGLFVLCAPDRPEDAEDVDTAKAMALLTAVREHFDYVIVDTGAGLDEITLAAVEMSTDLVFVSSTDVPSVRGVQKVVDLFDRLQLTNQQRLLVLNRADAKVGLLPNDIAMTTRLPVSLTLPSSRSVPTALNQGRSLVEVEPKSVIARNMREFARIITGTESANGGKAVRRAR